MRSSLRELLFTEDKLYPPRLGNLAAWFDALDTQTMLSGNGTVITDGGAVALWSDKSGNSGVNCLVLNGGAGNYAAIPDAANLSGFTAGITITVRVRMPDYTPSANMVFVCKDDTTTREYGFRILTTGELGFYGNPSGTFVEVGSTGASLTDHAAYWLKVSKNLATGLVSFFKQADTGTNVRPSSGWTAIGTAADTSGTLSSGAATLNVGAILVGSNPLTGNVFYASVNNGVDNAGTDIAIIDFSAPAKKLANGDTFVCATGQTVTLNSSGATGARIAGERDLFQGTAANRPVYLNFNGTKYAYFAGIAGFTVSVPLANDTYDVAITYKGGTSDTSTVVVGAGVAAFGGTDVKFAGKMVTRIVVSKSSVTQATFDPSLYTSGTSFTSSDGLTWTINGGAHIVTRTGLYGDGVNDFVKMAAASLVQPLTVYLAGEQTSWTDVDRLYDGGSNSTMVLRQLTSSPNLGFSSDAINEINASGEVLKTAQLLTGVLNGASGAVRVNRQAAVTGNVGTNNPNGFTLMALADGSARYANMFVSEVAIYSAAHATATQDRMALYAGRKWGFSV